MRLPLLLLAVLGLAAPAAHAATIELPLDGGRFWLGGQIESGDVQDASMCDVLGPCPTFTLRVPDGGHRLRVAYDTPSRETSLRLDLIAPDGTVTSQSGSNVFNAEAFVERPAGGAWTVRVVPTRARRAFVRLRARLEPAPPGAAGAVRPLLPNLRAVPPYELGFVAPANPLNAAYPPDTVNPPLSALGQEPVSCTADEAAPVAAGGGGARDCLRLTSGPINVGDGPFMKTFTFAGDATGNHLQGDGAYVRGDAVQVIRYSDGSLRERPAGTYSFHTTHAHFHDDGILTYELLRADGDALVPAGAGTKSGFCPADQLMGDWRTFHQDVAGFFGEGDSIGGSCYGAADDGLLALTRGWGDVYRWQRPGQYVEFAGNGDGLYVVRTTVDKGDTTLETDETDNSAYALVRITGRRIESVERGWGTSHLDPAKVVFRGFGPASQDAFGDVPGTTQVAAGVRGRDTTPPRVRRARVRGRVLRFALSEASRVRVTVLRGRRVLRRLRFSGRRGANSRRLPRLAHGRYRIAVAATDRAGNAARPVVLRLRR